MVLGEAGFELVELGLAGAVLRFDIATLQRMRQVMTDVAA
jgi:hypothetical protein